MVFAEVRVQIPVSLSFHNSISCFLNCNYLILAFNFYLHSCLLVLLKFAAKLMLNVIFPTSLMENQGLSAADEAILT